MRAHFPLSTMNSLPLCLTVFILFVGLLEVSHAVPTTVTFDTDFNTGLGAGNIISQGDPEKVRIFSYRENGLYASAIPFTTPDPNEPPSHYHLLNATTLGVPVDNIGLLLGDDSAGIQFTYGGMGPTIPFDVLGLDIFEIGEPGFIGHAFFRSFIGPTQVGEIILPPGFTGSPMFNTAEWSNITHFTATFGTPGASPPDGGRLVMDNLQVNAVPEPSTIWLFGIGLAGLWFLRHKRKPVSS